jgi:hypothetical protein
LGAGGIAFANRAGGVPNPRIEGAVTMLHIIGTLLAIAFIAAGCNHDNVRAEHQAETNELAREHAEERREADDSQERAELAQDHQEERADLQQEHAEERREEREDTREEMIGRTNEMAENNAERSQDLNQDVRELNTLITEACVGVAETDRTTCPLSGDRVDGVNNIDGGLRIRLKPVAGNKLMLEQRVACYRARAEIRHSVERLTAKHKATNLAVNDCLLDQPGVEIALTEDEGQVHVELTTDDNSRVRELRTQARALGPTSAAGPSSQRRTNSDPNGVATR